MSAIKEMTSIEELAIDNNIDLDLLASYANNEGIDDPEEAFEAFNDNYQGTYDNLEAWAMDLLDNTGELECMPERLRYYFDYEAYARDCRLGGDIYTIEINYQVAVFWNR